MHKHFIRIPFHAGRVGRASGLFREFLFELVDAAAAGGNRDGEFLDVRAPRPREKQKECERFPHGVSPSTEYLGSVIDLKSTTPRQIPVEPC